MNKCRVFGGQVSSRFFLDPIGQARQAFDVEAELKEKLKNLETRVFELDSADSRWESCFNCTPESLKGFLNFLFLKSVALLGMF